MDARIWFGTQGWQYSDWVGNFYPPGTQAKDMLTEYGRALDTVEIDSTYYATPAAKTFEGWRRRSPDGFRFALKTPSEITHVRRLRDAEGPFAEFVERAKLLGPKLGALLVQCPPDFDPTPENRDALFNFMESQLPPRRAGTARRALVRRRSVRPRAPGSVYARDDRGIALQSCACEQDRR